MDSRELRDQDVALLPDREALSYLKVTVARVKAWNSAHSLVLWSGHSSSTALAGQTILIG